MAHPGTGEVLGQLDQLPDETVAEVFHEISERQAQLKALGEEVEVELRRRMALHDRRRWTVGNYGLEIEPPRNESQWDGDELEGVLRNLVDDGVMQANELTGVIRHETIVSRTEAKSLLNKLSGPARAAVERCCTWTPKGRSRLRVVRQVELIPSHPERQETS